jgi:predicted alpha/beta-fold hydrolase
MHLRGAGKETNRLPRTYHSGETNDLNAILRQLSQREPDTKKAIVGISLGGNIVLKWLGENPEQTHIHSATAVSVPFELHRVSHKINQGFSRVYQAHLLRKMRKLYSRKFDQESENTAKEIEKLNAIQDFHTFDECITAPIHGFKNAEDYYQKSSSRQFLKHISVPTLIIHALDDPFMTPEVIPLEHELSQSIHLELSPKGGHVGFISGNIPGKAEYWLDERIPRFLGGFLD